MDKTCRNCRATEQGVCFSESVKTGKHTEKEEWYCLWIGKKVDPDKQGCDEWERQRKDKP